MRLFLAVPIPGAVAHAAFALLPPPVPALRRVRPELMHLTLAFLGDAPDARLPDAISAAAAAAAGHRPFPLTLDRAGRFPAEGVPRVIWLGVGEGRASLQALAERVVSALRERGLRSEERPFRPHLTLARVQAGTALPEARAIAAAVAALRVAALVVPVERIAVVESVLLAHGPRYTERGGSALGAAGPPAPAAGPKVRRRRR